MAAYGVCASVPGGTDAVQHRVRGGGGEAPRKFLRLAELGEAGAAVQGSWLRCAAGAWGNPALLQLPLSGPRA